MNEVRLGIIGLGNIGRHHAGYLLAGEVPRCRLTAVVTRRPPALALPENVAVFPDAEALFRSGAVDAVLIATPHYSHFPLGAAAFAAGLHVVVEKPIAAHKADAERLLAAHARRPDRVFAAMFQMRVEPRYQKLRDLVRGGALGRVTRVNWINTDWFRPEAYYQSSAWRATWRGEGGGVLINQCLHNLDMLQWLVGPPARVRGFGGFGRFHDIEVEDDVTAYLEWPDGATGVFIGSTGEAPGTNRLEIAGSRGRVVLENQRLLFTQNETDAAEFCRTTDNAFAKPAATTLEIPFTDAARPHAELLANFVAAILDGVPLLAPGAEGVASIELANAIVLSALQNETVPLPLDAAAWEAKLNELIAGSRRGERAVRQVTGDVAGSFKR
ncbi:MAG: Gfo/Idh/MocA family protein [Limisphaerales bacterium]